MQPSNAILLILLTLEGIIIWFNPLFKNANSPISSRLSGSVISVRLFELTNESSPIIFKVLGRVILLRFSLKLNDPV